MSIEYYTPTRLMLPDSYYDKNSADFAIAFISNIIRNSSENLFSLSSWQEQIVRDLIGVKKINGFRQFRYSYTVIPKKQYYSELSAAIALLLTCADREPRAEVYSCATDHQQVSIVFDLVCDMVDQCRELKRLIKPLISKKRLIYKPLNSFYQVLSVEDYANQGLYAHSAIFDKVNAKSNTEFFDIMTCGSAVAQNQSIFFTISTDVPNESSYYWNQFQKAKHILHLTDPTFYPFIYSTITKDD